MSDTVETAQTTIPLSEEWQKIKSAKIAAIEFNPIDRPHLLSSVAACCQNRKIYYWNFGYEFLQQYIEGKLIETQFELKEKPLKIITQIKDSATFIFEGLGQIDRLLGFELKNFYFEQKQKQQIIIADDYLDIPIDLFAIVNSIRIKIPTIEQIKKILELEGILQGENLTNACFGLYRGEIEMLVRNCGFNSVNELEELKSTAINFKTCKLAEQGLQIAPAPDIDAVGGLEKIEEDLKMIAAMSSPEAKKRGLRLPKACLLLGLPGTGKSLISKLMGKKLGAVIVSCDWNQLLDGDNLARSLFNLQRVLDIVDNIGGTCILFFDEFEKAYSGWDTGGNGGVLAKMAGTLLKWMEDHTTPVIMLATINHLDMLPPELIRRFEYRWFFDSDLHNGAMQEIFLLHIDKHFPDLNGSLNREQWFSIFSNYRGCSPDEIGKSVAAAHQRLFYTGQCKNIDPETLKKALIYQRGQFTPAIENPQISDMLFKIRKHKGFARPVRGEDKSEFAVKSRRIFEINENSIQLQKDLALSNFVEESIWLFQSFLDSEPNLKYSYVYL